MVKIVEAINSERSIRATIKRNTEPRRDIAQCVIVEVDGSVYVPDRNSYVWVREGTSANDVSGGVFPVLNPDAVTPSVNLPVLVGSSPKPPYKRQILSYNSERMGYTSGNYLTTSQHAILDANVHSSGVATDGYVLTADGAGASDWEAPTGGDHGALTGLSDDDHSAIYLNAARHAALDANVHSSGAAGAGLVLTADGAGAADWDTVPTGPAVSGVTKTVGSGKDFATIQEAIDWFSGKILTGSCYIDVDAGSYTETLTVSGYLCAGSTRLIIRGDQRALAGLTYVGGVGADTVPGNRGAITNGGTGNVTLSRGGYGNTILTIGLSTANPDLETAGFVYGDKIAVWDGTSITEVEITDATATTLMQTGAWPANINLLGSAVCLKPNRKITGAIGIYSPCTLQGFEIVQSAVSIVIYANTNLYNLLIIGSANNNAIYMQQAGVRSDGNSALSVWNAGNAFAVPVPSYLSVGNAIAVKPAWYGGYAAGGGSLYAPYSICTAAGLYAAYVEKSASAEINLSYAINCDKGFRAMLAGSINADSSKAYTCPYGFLASQGGVMYAASATAHNCSSAGYYASHNGYLNATSTNANNSGNGADYNPATSDTEGNVSGIITWS